MGGQGVDLVDGGWEPPGVGRDRGVDQLLERGAKLIDHLGIFAYDGYGPVTAPTG